jgi:hypothetical protein
MTHYDNDLRRKASKRVFNRTVDDVGMLVYAWRLGRNPGWRGAKNEQLSLTHLRPKYVYI